MKKHLLHVAMAAMALVTVQTSFAQVDYSDCGCPTVGSRTVVNLSTLADANGNLTAGTTTLSCSNLYKLNKTIYVTDGKTLNVPAGTVIKGMSGTGLDAKSLIVCQGGKINAVGSPSCPIIFTADADPLDGSFSSCTNNAWGGVVILGKAHNNVKLGDTHPSGDPVAFDDGVGYIEGLDVPDVRHHYGKYPSTTVGGAGVFYDDDNSGILKYVSIRHGGTIIGAANEINGLTMGSVGRGTTVDYVEVVSNLDDAFEFFGGTVNVSHLIAMFQGDDAFDWDQYYSGKGQFLYTVQHPDTVSVPSQTSHGMELDGQDVTGRTPVSDAIFANVTAIGNYNSKNAGINAKAETGGQVINSVFANFKKGYLQGGTTSLVASCNTFVNVPAGTLPTGTTNIISTTSGIDYRLEVASGCNINAGTINPVPASVADIKPTSCDVAADNFFTQVDYRGAFAPGKTPWTESWTYSAQRGIGVADVDCATDNNGDGKTDGTDFSRLIGQFGLTCY